MKVISTQLPGVVVVEPRVFADERGYFLEMWNARSFSDAGLSDHFVQDNTSYSHHGVIRGLHYQYPYAQAKLVTVLSGEILDVAVDIRRGSATYGQWVGVELSSDNHRSLLIPTGFAHGFAVTGSHAILCYKCSDAYHPEAEHTIRWDDPDIGIDWPIASPVVSPKDADAPFLRDMSDEAVPALDA